MSRATPPGESVPNVPEWNDPSLGTARRIQALLDAMTLEEKVAQLAGVWVTVEGDLDGNRQMVPHQHQLQDDDRPLDELTRHGIGQLTRVYGTRPVDPVAGARALAAMQRDLMDRTRLGIPAMVHEECLSGLTAYRAAAFPTPLAWAAAFDPSAVEEMAAMIGRDMVALGIHQGLAPVLDVVRDPRWGRVEETLGEDPYLVSVLGAAYVRGLEGTGVIATLKHFAGYSASRAARNLAPVSMGVREFADVVLPPFEVALREGGARSVMHAYTDIDGLPSVADEGLLTTLLRQEWGFEGVVVADYFGIAFLETLHRVAASPGDAAAQALEAGVDVELPTVRCYGEPLLEQVRRGRTPVDLVDRALARVLRQKVEAGLLDPDWSPEPPVLRGLSDGEARDIPGGTGNRHAGVPSHWLDSSAHRSLARRIAEESVVLLSNPAEALPLPPSLGRLLVVGPCADDPLTMLGCYSFPNHVGSHHPEAGLGVEIPTVLEALRCQMPHAQIEHVQGCSVDGRDRSGFAEAVAAARAAEVCLVVLGDRSGLFGHGTSGEGCDVEDLSLPGVQGELLDAIVDTGVPVVLLTISGRPYAVGRWRGRLAAHLQSFFPGEEGGRAIASILTGETSPSGRLPVQMPRSPGGQPATYLHPQLGAPNEVSVVDPSPLHPFGHGLTYTTFAYSDLGLDDTLLATDAETTVRCVVTNVGPRAGTEVVQLYLGDPVGQVTRPVRQLAGFVRVTLEAGCSAQVEFTLHADRTSFTGRALRRVVEPGVVEIFVGASAGDLPLHGRLELVGEERQVGHDRVLLTPVRVTPWGSEGGRTSAPRGREGRFGGVVPA